MIWTCQTFEINFGMKHILSKSLKESCRWCSGEYFSFDYLLNIAFVGEISPELSSGLAADRHEWVNAIMLLVATLANTK